MASRATGVAMPFFKHDGLNICYDIAGSGPPILFINGLAGDVSQWDLIIGSLTPSFQVITYDMRCAGRSDKPKAEFIISDLADEARGLMGHMGHEKVSVLGFSMGGMVAMQLAIDHPDVVEGLFLVATAPSFTRPHPISEDTRVMLHRTDVSPELIAMVYERIFGSKYRKKVSAEAYIKLRMEDANPQPAEAYLNQLGACEAADLCDRVGEISAPSCIIVGDEDGVIPPENSYWLNGQIAGSKLFVLNGIGHVIPVEAPDALTDILISNA